MVKFLLFFSILFIGKIFAQVDKNSDLFKILKANDSLLFSVGFNHIDTMPFIRLLSDNFECYHDEAGIVSSKSAFIESIKSFSKLDYRPKRKLVENSLEVFALKKNGIIYGAIQTGQHRFYSTGVERQDRLTSTAIFNHLWLLENGKWKLARVLSYNHQGGAQ